MNIRTHILVPLALLLLGGAARAADFTVTVEPNYPPAQAQDAPIVQPGAPGQASRTLEARDAARVSDNRYSDDDVAFMQGMIVHHQQAVDMANLVADRTNTPEIVELAGRIRASQDDEIAFMRTWLTERGESVPAATDPHAGHGGQGRARIDGSGVHAGDRTMQAWHASPSILRPPREVSSTRRSRTLHPSLPR